MRKHLHRPSFKVGLLLCLAGLPRLCLAAATTGLTTPYYQVSDSPLVTSSPGFHLENFESGVFNDPGVTLTSLNGYSIVTGFSVDADDGTIDGSGAAGHSLDATTSGGQCEVTFSFNSGILGGLPKSVAVAITACEGAGTMVFTTYDASSHVSGTYTLNAPSANTPTSDDFLLWGSDPSGISAIDVTYNSAYTSTFLDHFQYDMLNTVTVPEPSSLALVAVGLGLLALVSRRAKPQAHAHPLP